MIQNGTSSQTAIKQKRWDNEIFHFRHLQFKISPWLSSWDSSSSGDWGGGVIYWVLLLRTNISLPLEPQRLWSCMSFTLQCEVELSWGRQRPLKTTVDLKQWLNKGSQGRGIRLPTRGSSWPNCQWDGGHNVTVNIRRNNAIIYWMAWN